MRVCREFANGFSQSEVSMRNRRCVIGWSIPVLEECKRRQAPNYPINDSAAEQSGARSERRRERQRRRAWILRPTTERTLRYISTETRPPCDFIRFRCVFSFCTGGGTAREAPLRLMNLFFQIWELQWKNRWHVSFNHPGLTVGSKRGRKKRRNR